MRYVRCVAILFLLPLLWAATRVADAEASEAEIGFLVARTSLDDLGAEAAAAWEAAQKFGAETLLLPRAEGRFADARGNRVALDRFTVIWCHEGDATDALNLFDDAVMQALRSYLGQGGRLFLSGAALAMVERLGLESKRPRLGGPGRDRYVAGLVPVVDSHPVFAGLTRSGVDIDASVGGNPRVFRILISDAGYPAYADFIGTKGPLGGRLLARATAGDENPLVEYAAGPGRVIAMGWRLAHYSNAANAHRANLERLTGNVLGYLSSREQWQPLSADPVDTQSPPPAGIAAAEWQALERAVIDLNDTFGDRYPKGRHYLRLLRGLEHAHDALLAAGPDLGRLHDFQLRHIVDDFRNLQREALLANPLLDFDQLLVIERNAKQLGLPANWQSNSSLPTQGFSNRLAVLSPVRPEGKLTTVYQPEEGRFIGDVDLHWDAERLLFSMPGSLGRWQVFELRLGDAAPRELPLIHEPDVDNYDACYLPDDRILFTSTAPFVGVPCVYGNSHVTNLYRLESDGSIRQLTVDQEHNWCPTMLNNGRVLYLRWEYTDLPHANSRILFHMNPDGTAQMEYYGSNSYFPNSFFYARPIPNHPSQVVGIASGHHGVARAGRLLILDPARGRQEADGVVQEIPGWGKPVPPIIADPLVDGVWPQFLHPYPLSEKYFLVSARPEASQPWGIYLVDVFDNRVLIKEAAGQALLEPLPLRRTARPPVAADRIDPQRQDALIYMTDIYQGPGLRGIPRGTVQQLRLISYEFSYRDMGGLLGAVGMDGPWDVKRILGTVPVAPDGSAQFRVPAYTPIAVQPLDADGRALQLMRSWFTAMPGEVLTCVGCHERQNESSPNLATAAAKREPDEIQPWFGSARGFAFSREIQPVLDHYCIDCHDGQPREGQAATIDLRGDKAVSDWTSGIAGHVNPAVGGQFSTAYVELHRFVRRPGIESDLRLLSPMEFHASTTELLQLLDKGHYGVRLDPESWNRLVTWIDLNAPFHGSWNEIVGCEKAEPLAARAREMRRRYTGMQEPAEDTPVPCVLGSPWPRQPPRTSPEADEVTLADWPWSAEEAQRRQHALGDWQRTIDLGEGVEMTLVRVPPGRFVMGSTEGAPDEQPPTVIEVAQPFWIGRCEVTNEQFRRFKPDHDSRVESMHGYQFGIRGYPMDKPQQPAVRLSWNDAWRFCDWLSERTGKRFSLPTEAQWEYACRAGSGSPLWYGDLDTDFSRLANLGDARLSEFALDTYIQVQLVDRPNRYDDWIPKESRFNDGGFVTMPVGSYTPNPWGLYDVHGNASEWTRTAYRPYPYRDDDGRNEHTASGPRVVRGGSWYDRPVRCRSAFRLAYAPYQPVFHVGFRVIMLEE